MPTTTLVFIAILALFAPLRAVHGQTSYVWTGGSGDWDTAANWTPEGVPTVTDTVRIESGSVTITSDKTVAGFYLERIDASAGQLIGDADLTVLDTMVWAGNNFSIPSFGGTGDVIVGEGARLLLPGTGSRLIMASGRRLVNHGLTIWEDASTLSVWQGDGFLLNHGELILDISDASSDTDFFVDGADAIINSEAGLVRLTGPGRFDVFAAFNNRGVLRVESGTLSLVGFNEDQGVSSGRFEVLGDGRLRLGRHILTVTAVITGDGTIVQRANTGSQVPIDAATWRPGLSPGVLRIDHRVPWDLGALELEIGGLTPGVEHDQLSLTSELASPWPLGGTTLAVEFIDGFTPLVGDRFLIISSPNGTFGEFEAVTLSEGIEAVVENTDDGVELVVTSVVATEPDRSEFEGFALESVYPNPIGARAAIRYTVPVAGHVTLSVYDVLGREVVVLVDDQVRAGLYEVPLDGRHFASGVYFVRMSAEGGVLRSKAVVVQK